MTISLDGSVTDHSGNAGSLYPALAALLLEKINLHEVGPRTSLRFRIKR
jgi:hypothetical protein